MRQLSAFDEEVVSLLISIGFTGGPVKRHVDAPGITTYLYNYNSYSIIIDVYVSESLHNLRVNKGDTVKDVYYVSTLDKKKVIKETIYKEFTNELRTIKLEKILC